MRLASPSSLLTKLHWGQFQVAAPPIKSGEGEAEEEVLLTSNSHMFGARMVDVDTCADPAPFAFCRGASPVLVALLNVKRADSA